MHQPFTAYPAYGSTMTAPVAEESHFAAGSRVVEVASRLTRYTRARAHD